MMSQRQQTGQSGPVLPQSRRKQPLPRMNYTQSEKQELIDQGLEQIMSGKQGSISDAPIGCSQSEQLSTLKDSYPDDKQSQSMIYNFTPRSTKGLKKHLTDAAKHQIL